MRKLVSTLMTVTLMLVSVTACAERITPSKNYVTKKVMWVVLMLSLPVLRWM